MLKGNLAPDGALIKAAAATPALFETEGRAVVFDGLVDLIARIDDPALDVEPNDFLLLKNVGPVGAGMPEAGYLPIPKKLARQGVKDMVRISDARMSGTAAGSFRDTILNSSEAPGDGLSRERGQLGIVPSIRQAD
jgi:dihydroxy-acid dehydratase